MPDGRPSLGDIFGVQDDRPPLGAIFGTSDFSDVTGGVSSAADDLLRKKREQMAQARQIAAAQGLAGPAPSQSVGDRALALGDRAVSAAAEGVVSLPELYGKAAEFMNPSSVDTPDGGRFGLKESPFADVYPTIGKPGGFLDLHAQRADIAQQAAAARERMLASEGDPAVVAAADTLAEAAAMAIPLGEGGRAAKAAEDAQGAVRFSLPRGAAPVARAAEDLTPEEAAYLAKRARGLNTIPGAVEPVATPEMVREALRPEAKILQVGEHADNAARDVAVGLRARPQDAADAAELARASLPLGEEALSAPSRLVPQTPRWAASPEDGLARWPAFAKANAGKLIDPADLPFALEDLPLTRWESTPGAVNPARGATNWSLGDTEMYRFKEPPANLEARLADRSTEGGHLPRAATITPQRPLVMIGKSEASSIMNNDAEAALRRGHDAVIKISSENPFYADVITHPVASLTDRSSPYLRSLAEGGPRDPARDFSGRFDRMLATDAPPSFPHESPPSPAEIFGDPVDHSVNSLAAESLYRNRPSVEGENLQSPPAGSAAPADAPPEQFFRNALTREELPADTPHTGTKNTVTEGERIARGLPEVEALARKSTGGVWAEARQTFAADPEAPRLLAARIAEKPRTLTTVENDLLLHDRMKMSLDHRDALSTEMAALDAGDQEAAAMAKMRRQSLEQAMDVNDTALKRAGTEWSAGGQARQKLISEDYSPLYLRQRLTVAAREAGTTPIPGAVEKLDQLSRQLADAQAQLASYEERLSQVHAEKAVAAAQRDVAVAERSGVRRAARETLDQEYEGLAAQLEVKARKNQSTVNMSGGLDPETVGIIGKMAKNRVQAGARGLGDVVDGIFQTIRPHIEGLEPREVRDAISGYGVVRQQATHSEAVAELAKIRQQARLVSKLDDLQETGSLPAPQARAKPAAEVAALQEKLRQVTRDLDANPLRTDAQRLAAMKTRLEKRITDAERGLAPRAARAPLPDTPETAALRKKLAQMMDEHGLAPDPEAQRLAALKTRLTNRAAELEKHIAEGYIPKKVRRPAALDAQAIALQGKVNGLKRQADLIIRKQGLAGRTGAEKALDLTAGWGRFLKLTGVSTLQKISAAAAERSLVFRPLEEFLGAGISKVPLVRDFAREAPIEGGGSLKAVAKSYSGFFGKAAREELKAHLRGSEGPMALALGKPHLGGETPAWMSYPGHIHAGLKAPAKIAGYEYAMEKQAVHYLHLGQAEKLTDPVVIEEMKARAWEHANRDIFMGDNAAVNAFRRASAHQEGDSLAARAGKTVANVLMPIVKVPTNYALEATDYLAGLPKAAGYMAGTIRAGKKALAGESASLAEVVHAGLQALPNGRADLILRQLKKGSLGAGLIALGATGVVRVGGYYDGPRREGDLQPGQIEIAGHVVPHMILHYPALEALQVGGAIYRAKTLAGGLGTAAKGLAEGVPFVETPVSMARDLWGREPMKAVGQFERGMTIPPDAQRLARVLDQKRPTTPAEKLLQQLGWQDIEAKKRKTRGPLLHQLVGQEELGIPGLRDNVR